MKPHIKPWRTAHALLWHVQYKDSHAVAETPEDALRCLYSRILLNRGRKGLWPAAVVHNMVRSYA